MKILHLFDMFSPHGGGTVSLLYKLAQAQARRGHQVTIYTSDFKLDREYIASLPEVKINAFHCISSTGLFYITPSLNKAVREHLRDFFSSNLIRLLYLMANYSTKEAGTCLFC